MQYKEHGISQNRKTDKHKPVLYFGCMTMLQTIQKSLSKIIQKRHGVDPTTIDVSVSYPPDARFGDYATPVALSLGRKIKKDPREVAQEVSHDLGEALDSKVEKVSVEGPGYINVKLNDRVLLHTVKEILEKKNQYGAVAAAKPKRINVEFISANPTGPLTLANGRGGFFGDALASLLQLAGHTVSREFYVNDRGNQINILAESVLRKYFSQHGIPTEYPEYCYQGVYIDELARELHMPNYNIAKTPLTEIRDKIKDKIVAKMVKSIQRVVDKKMGIHFDMWFSEKSLFDAGGPVERTLELISEKSLAYEKDGATWLATSKFGDEKDRVITKADGEHTYFLPDIAYHLDKLETRKFDRAITILGADHHGYVGRMLAAMAMFGHSGQVDIIIMQLVKLLQNGKEVRMSKRRGTYVEIEDVLDEVGLDAARYFFCMYAPNTHMDFNLDIAKVQNEKNPVYYVQYAHARICSILKMIALKNAPMQTKAQKALSPSTRALLVMLSRWPEVVESAAQEYAVHRLPTYAHDVATAFHGFYNNDRVITTDGTVNPFLLSVVEATRQVLKNILSVLGISAPERMD